MIVQMKKINIVTQAKDAAGAVKALRGLGVLHVEHRVAPKGIDINELSANIALVSSASAVLNGPEFISRIPSENGRHVRDWKAAAHHIVDLWKRIDQLGEYSRSVIANIKEWQMWGDFDPDAILALKEKGVSVRLYEVPADRFEELSKGIVVKKIFVFKGVIGCVVASKNGLELPFKEKAIPKMSLNKMKARLAEETRAIQTIKNNITRHLRYRATLDRIKLALERELELHEAWRGMGEDGTLMYITGYVPSDDAGMLAKASGKEKWGLTVEDPSEDDVVPTLIRNPKWVSIIEPLFKVITIVPGYRELDISLWFLIFFSIFFGMLIGDAGTGLVFVALTLFAQLKFGSRVRDKSIFALFYVLSGFAIVWGILSGTFFGQAWLPQWFKPLMPALREDRKVQALCFFIGATHMSLGHAWRAILKAPALVALCDIGWAMILWGAYFVAGLLVLGNDFPPFASWLLIIGSVLVAFFTDPSKGILKGLPGGFGNLLLNIMNSLTDVVSYVRLFAVGLASVAVADSFNQIAADIGLGTFGKSIVTAFIIVFGQMLNIVLGPLSVLVHGVRLNVLEFCNHVDIKWTGFQYRPLEGHSAK